MKNWLRFRKCKRALIFNYAIVLKTVTGIQKNKQVVAATFRDEVFDVLCPGQEASAVNVIGE